MLKNYLKVALRNLWRNKAFSAINIAGLSLGIATCLLIALYIHNELSYDRFNTKADRMVRVNFHGKMQGGEMKEANVMPPVAQALKDNFPEVEEATRIRAYGSPRVSYNMKVFNAPFAFVDSNFFQVFTIPLLKGDAATALQQPNTVVISKAVAQQYFGNEDPIGKTLDFKDANAAMKVTGVFDKIPANSHFHFDLLASMSGLPEAKSDSWMDSNFFTYLVLQKGCDYKKLEAKIPALFDKFVAPQMQKRMNMSLQQFKAGGNSIGLELQPITDIHLHSDLSGDLEASGDIRYIYIFSAVAIFMLLIAAINFMNLSTAGASKRAREVGVRKVLGSMRKELISQFLAESLVITAFAIIISLALVYMALPWFNQLTGQDVEIHPFSDPRILPALLLFGLFTGLLAGSYPAFFLSSFRPIAVLKGKFTTGKKSIGLRSGLVVFQFFISISLMVGTTVVYKQLSYIQHKKLGYDRDRVVIVEDPQWLGKNQEVFRQQLLQDPQITSVSRSGYIPAGFSYNNNFFAASDINPSQLVKALRYSVDENYIPTLGMQLAAGRNFSKEYESDSSAVIVNETAAKQFGWGEKALGHTISSDNGGKVTYTVVGVVKDFHFRSLHEQISPLVMVLGHDEGSIIVKTKTTNIAGLLAMMKKTWDGLTTEAAFSWSFLDRRFADTYKAEQNIAHILGIFAGLTIFVACLGLFGLATFSAEQRLKEIGIRKVLGAGTMGIVTLLSKDFLKLVLLAFVLAAPVAWVVMNKWLSEFAYRISIGWQVFALAAVLASFVTLATIGIRALQAATANPIDSLRSE